MHLRGELTAPAFGHADQFHPGIIGQIVFYDLVGPVVGRIVRGAVAGDAADAQRGVRGEVSVVAQLAALVGHRARIDDRRLADACVGTDGGVGHHHRARAQLRRARDHRRRVQCRAQHRAPHPAAFADDPPPFTEPHKPGAAEDPVTALLGRLKENQEYEVRAAALEADVGRRVLRSAVRGVDAAAPGPQASPAPPAAGSARASGFRVSRCTIAMVAPASTPSPWTNATNIQNRIGCCATMYGWPCARSR